MKNNSGSLLIVDDEAGIRDLLRSEFTARGYQVSSAVNGEEALIQLAKHHFQVALCDIRMPELDGLETLRRMQIQDPDLQVIMMTGYASVESAINAMKRGAYDFIEKPFHMDQVASVVDRALIHRDMRAMVRVYDISRIVFNTVDLEHLLPALAKNVQQILAADEVSVLLRYGAQDWTTVFPEGESGWETDHRTLACLVQPVLSEAREPFLASSDILENTPSISSALFCPLYAANDWKGLLLVVRRSPNPAFLPLDVRHGTIFASFAVQAIKNARLYDQLIYQWKDLDEAHRALKETQQQLIQNEKMAVIGQLAAGVAHQLNNPMTGIIGFSKMLSTDASLSAQQRQDIDMIYQQSQRCRKIIQNLLKFSRHSEPNQQKLDLCTVILAAEELARYEVVSTPVRIENKISIGLPLVLGDPNELQHLFLNLLTNATQALSGYPNPCIHIDAVVKDQSVFIHVRDNGPGIVPENLPKIFDPFFTTKATGEGTGLGLSICQNIAKNHGGRLTAESELGNGALFTLELPIAS